MEYYWKKKKVVSFACALLVTLIHLKVSPYYPALQSSAVGKAIGWIEVFFQNGIGAVAVPLFFVMSGATLFCNYSDDKYLAKLKSRFHSLVVPYLLWNTLIVIAHMVLDYSPLASSFAAEDTIELSCLPILRAILFYDRLKGFWFVYNLIFFVILTPLFSFALKNKMTAALFSVFLLVLPLFGTDAMAFFHLSARSPFYYFTGCVIGKYFFDLFRSRNRSRSGLGIVGCVVCTIVLLCDWNGVLSLHEAARQLIIVCFAISFWVAFDILAKAGEFPDKGYMQYNFFLFAAHPFVQTVLLKLCARVLPATGFTEAFVYLFTGVFTVVICVLTASAVKKTAPGLYRAMSGGR